MARRLKDGILKAFLDYTRKTEVPVLYALWSGIATISTALGRDCFIDMGHYTVYPNLFIVFIAGSGKCKKSTSIGIAESFIRNINPRVQVFMQKGTPEALIQTLAGIKLDEEENTVRACAEGILIADEFATLINKNSERNGMTELLTVLWDSKDEFTYETRSHGKETIRNSCVSLLAGSTIAWVKEAIGLSAISGGFTARIIFVYKENPDKFVLRTPRDPVIESLGKDIQNDLNIIAKMRGGFKIPEDSWKVLEQGYKKFMTSSKMHDNKYLSGYANKRTSNLLKICMIVSASLRDDMIITVQDIATATGIIENAEQFMPKVMLAIAADDTGIDTGYVMEIIEVKKRIERKTLLNIVHHRMNANKLDDCLDTLEQSGRVNRIISGKSHLITLVQDTIERNVVNESFTERILKGEIK
jgi:hypothetical protein